MAPPPRKVPWYRRMFRKSQATLQAGARPQSITDPRTTVSGLLGRVLPFAVVVVIMGVIGSYLVVPDIHLEVNRTIAQLKRQFLPDLAPVTPVATGRAFDAIDNNKLTWWQSGGNKPSLSLDFEPTVDLANIIVTNGAAGDDFAALRRPLTLDLVVDGKVQGTLTLTDSRDPQSLGVDLKDVSELRLVVTKSTGPDGEPVAIRELEFTASR